MPNVLSIVSYKFLPPKMGGQKGIALFNKFLSPHVDLYCLTTKNNEPDNTTGYEVINTLSNSKLRYINPFIFFKAKQIIKQKKITHVILEHPYLGWLGLMLKWFCGIKLIVHSHNIESLRFKSMNKWWWGILWNYERSIHRRADINFFIHDDDKAYAIEKFKLNPSRCFTITYGIEIESVPSIEERRSAREKLAAVYNIQKEETIFLFNGTLDYKPNLDALNLVIHKINPILLQKNDFKYKIIICGKNLPAEYDGLKKYNSQNIIYAGFVDDISLFFKGSDIFLNPVNDGGGIKTKLVEALGYNMNVVTTNSGATGVSTDITGGKMKVIADSDWDSFGEAIFKSDVSLSTPKEFFDHFYWGNIAKKAAAIIIES